MKSVELTDRCGLWLRNQGHGKVGLLCLAVAGIALSLAGTGCRPSSASPLSFPTSTGSSSPGRAFTPQEQGSLVGVWRSTTVINGVLITQVSIAKADGTFASRTVGGGIVLDCTGRYTYANGIQTLTYDNGWYEEDSVVWVNPNQVIVTCLRSSMPEAVGLKLVAHRIR